MPSLTDHIDRLTRSTKTVKASASSIISHSHSGPFTASVLTSPLGDLIRDVDPAELGLFSLIPPPQTVAPRDSTQPGPPPEITRVEVVSATPLRKHPSAHRRDVLIQSKEPEPEVFAEAALKYIDRYAGIRPMPRVRSQVVAMLEHLHQLREEIHSLNDSLQNMEASATTSDSQSPRSLVAKEERKLQDLQARIGQLKKRNHRSVPVPPVEDNPPASPGPPNSVASDPQEDTFWTTPGARRTLQFKNELLIDEDVDLGNVTSSFSTPVVPFKSTARLVAPTDGASFQEEEEPTECPTPGDSSTLEDTFDHSTKSPDSHVKNAELDDQTISKLGQSSLRSLPATTSEPSTPVVNTDQMAPSSTGSLVPQTHSAKRIRVTNEVERITSKIWATVGDLVMLGSTFSTSGSIGSRSPRAKEIIAHLHTVAAQDPLPTSPTASSLSGTSLASAPSPTSQQVLTAHLLIALLEAAPHYALPLAKVKEILSAKGDAGTVAIGSGGPIRVLYGCVAKRLVKIDRGRGEQIVRFDV
ncbi:hypothetical protein BJV78DRAFT_1278820 [Lactifluus subvellereus]|nr:hypothetical protein BJV78DRAFT_1278820 [Lactifluus subvellereus]